MSDPLLLLFSEILETPVEKLHDNISPDNTAQWDSLTSMHLVAAIEHKFNIHLSTKDILNMSSIGKAREVLRTKNVTL